MTDSEMIDRVMQITSADDEAKKRIVERYYHYKNCSGSELLDSCILIQGMEAGADSLRADIKRLKNELLDAQNALTFLTVTLRDTRDAQKSFHNSAKGSKEWNEALRRSKMLEAECDKLLKAPWVPQPPKPPELFS